MKEDPFLTAHKPKEDGFPYDLETDSLADSMGLRLPNRSLYVLQGAVGGGYDLQTPLGHPMHARRCDVDTVGVGPPRPVSGEVASGEPKIDAPAFDTLSTAIEAANKHDVPGSQGGHAALCGNEDL